MTTQPCDSWPQKKPHRVSSNLVLTLVRVRTQWAKDAIYIRDVNLCPRCYAAYQQNPTAPGGVIERPEHE